MHAVIASFDRDEDAVNVAAVLREDGAVIVRDLVAPDVMDALTGKLAPELDRQEAGGGEFFGHRKKSVGRLLACGRGFSEHLLLNERMLEVTDAVLLPEFAMAASAPEKPRAETIDSTDYETLRVRRLVGPDPAFGPNCHHYRVNSAGSLQVLGGGTAQPLHREMGIYAPYVQHDPAWPECVLAVNWAGTDFTLDNGATQLVPGSHRWPKERRAEAHEVAQAVMPKGSAVFWLGKTLHGLGASRDDAPRTGLLFTFVVNWLTQEENQYLAVPPEIARTLPERAQQLLGYRSSPTLGWVPGLDQENMLVTGKGGPL